MGNTVRMSPEAFDETGDWEEYQVYFKQLAYVSGWDPGAMAVVLGLSLGGAIQSILTSLTLEQCRDYRILVEALKQNFSPAQQVHTYMAALNYRKIKPHRPLADLGCDMAHLI